MMKMQEEVEQVESENRRQQLYDAQKEALAMQQAAMLEQEKQQKMLQEQQLVSSQWFLLSFVFHMFSFVCFLPMDDRFCHNLSNFSYNFGTDASSNGGTCRETS